MDAFQKYITRETPDSSRLNGLPADPQQPLSLCAKLRLLLEVFRRGASLSLRPTDRQVVVVAGPRRLAQAVVAHGQEVQIEGQVLVPLRPEVGPEDVRRLAIAAGTVIGHAQRVAVDRALPGASRTAFSARGRAASTSRSASGAVR